MTMIYGVKCVSAQTEHDIKLLADLIRNKYPAVATLLEEGRYVDDEGESKATKEECYSLIEQADEREDIPKTSTYVFDGGHLLQVVTWPTDATYKYILEEYVSQIRQ